MQPFTVGQIRKLIADMPDDAPILRPGPDHSYYECAAWDGTAGYADGSYGEWWSVEDNPDEEPVRALIIR